MGQAGAARGAASAEFTEPEGENEDELPPAEPGDGVVPDDETPPDGEEVLAVSFGADPSPGSDDSEDDELEIDGKKVPAPPWVKELRESHRTTAAKLRETEAELKRLKTPAEETPTLIVVGEQPTMETCGYDAEKFAAELAAWYQRQRDADTQTQELERKKQAKTDAENARAGAYLKERAAIKAPDVEAVEKTALDKLSILQQNLILASCIKPALFVYALGKPQAAPKLLELSAITDPVKFVAAAARLETELKSKMVKPGIKPESKLSGNASTSATGDKKLESLRAEAEKTGNYTEVRKYKSALKQRAASGKR